MYLYFSTYFSDKNVSMYKYIIYLHTSITYLDMYVYKFSVVGRYLSQFCVNFLWWQFFLPHVIQKDSLLIQMAAPSKSKQTRAS